MDTALFKIEASSLETNDEEPSKELEFWLAQTHYTIKKFECYFTCIVQVPHFASFTT